MTSSPNLIADPTFATGAVISSDGTVVDNGDGTFRIDFTGLGNSNVTLDLTRALNPLHEYRVQFTAGDVPHNLKGQLIQPGSSVPVSIGSPPNLNAAGSYDVTYTFDPAVGTLKIWNSLQSGTAFSVEGSSISVTDLDAA